MTLTVKDANDQAVDLATGAGDGVTVPFQSPLSVTVGSQGDAAATSDTGAFSLMAFIKRALTNWTTLFGRLPASLGQKVSASSLPVVLPSDYTLTTTIGGTINVGNFPSVQQVAGNVTAFQGGVWTVGVGGTVAVTESGVWSTRTLDGAGNALTSLGLGAQRAITVAIVDAAGNQITSFGGGSGGGGSNFGSTFPTSGQAIGLSDGTNMQPLKMGQQLAAICVPVVLTAAQLATLTPFSTVGIAGTVPVTGTFWQATQPVSAAALPLPTGAALEAGNLATVAGAVTGAKMQVNVSQIGGAAPPLGHGTAAGALRVELPTDGTGVVLLGAGANAIGTINYNPGPAQMQHAAVSCNASGDNTLVAGVAAKKVRVYRLVLLFTAAVNIYYRDATGGTALSGVMPFGAGGSVVLDFTGEPWFTSATAGAFVLNLSAGVQCSGWLDYTQV